MLEGLEFGLYSKFGGSGIRVTLGMLFGVRIFSLDIELRISEALRDPRPSQAATAEKQLTPEAVNSSG